MFGTYEKHNLSRAAYSRRGSDMYITEDFYKRGLLKLGSQYAADMVSNTDFLLEIKMTRNGTPVSYIYFADEGSLILRNGDAFVEFAFTDRRHIRVRGKGAGLTLSLKSAFGGTARALRGFFEGEAEFGRFGKLYFAPIKGAFSAVTPWDFDKGEYSFADFSFLPDAATGEFDGAIHDYIGDTLEPYYGYDDFDEEVAYNRDDFEQWTTKYRKVAKGYETIAKYALWTIWSMRCEPRGQFVEPMIFFHKHWAIAAASWQQSYNAMSMQLDPAEAWRQVCTLFNYQDPRTGRLPGMLTYTNPLTGMQAPLQGFALDFLVRHIGDDFMTPESAVKMYPKFAKWANYWTTYRSAGRGDDVTALLSPHESGWDDASNFRNGFPANDPSNLAFLVLLFENVARLAYKAGLQSDGEAWDARAKKLTDTIINEFWDGEKFTTKVKGEVVDCLSLATFQPIILGKRLPQEIIDKVAEKLMVEGEWLTEIGLASESMKSELVTFGISFVCGRVVAPQNMILSVGLKSAGKDKEAAEIARRFCDKVRDEGIILGFAPYDYYPLTGQKADMQIPPIATDGWPWTSWCANTFLTMATYVVQ